MIAVLYQFTIRQINFGTLILLFCLMGVVAGIQRLGYIDLCTLYLMNRAQYQKDSILSDWKQLFL